MTATENVVSATETPTQPLVPATRVGGNIPINVSCIKPFDEFAYTFWDLENETGPAQVILPPSPWQMVEEIPSRTVEGSPPHSSDVVLARLVAGGQEIWIEQQMLATAGPGVKKTFVIYQPASRSWMNVPGNINGTEFYVKTLFTTSDGSVWGSTAGEYYKGAPVPKGKVPVLARYNERIHQFEFAQGVLEIDLRKADDPKAAWSAYFEKIDVVVDEQQSIFWIFAREDGIYRYEPARQTTQKWLDADLRNFFGPIVSPDGSIFVDDFRPERNVEPYFHLYKGSLLHFFPDTREIKALELPDEPWPWFSGWLVSRTGEVWIGSIGYRTKDGSWQLFYPDPEKYFENVGNPTWSTPSLMSESSNGLLWYRKYLDMGINHEGTAWYNPKTNEGCMFTNLAVNIVEDLQQQLWFVADGKLFKYQLNP